MRKCACQECGKHLNNAGGRCVTCYNAYRRAHRKPLAQVTRPCSTVRILGRPSEEEREDMKTYEPFGTTREVREQMEAEARGACPVCLDWGKQWGYDDRGEWRLMPCPECGGKGKVEA